MSEESEMPAALVHLSFLVQSVYAETGRRHALTPQQAKLLCVLMGGPLGMAELGGLLRLEKSTLTGLIDRAERRRLVLRHPDPTDRRAVQVKLTAGGRRAGGRFTAGVSDRLAELAGALSDHERHALTDLLGRVIRCHHPPGAFSEPWWPGECVNRTDR